MACYSPLTGYRSFVKNAKGKHSITFDKSKGYHDLPIKIACGQCIGCRLERSRQWAIRCMHESQMHKNNCFITLTYDNEHLPKNGSLVLKDLQDFMKRLRFHAADPDSEMNQNIITEGKLRYYACGEYGETFKRPHFHSCMFNLDFKDKEKYKINNGFQYYTSETLNKIWGKGYCIIGDVTFESAAYVARYIMKKITGDKSLETYTDFCKETGEVFAERRPEFNTMSRRPGIGKAWLEQYMSDVYPSDMVLVNYKPCSPPKYYDKQFEMVYPSDMEEIKKKRIKNSHKHALEKTPERLEVKEKIQKLKNKQLIRGYDNEN